MSGRSVEVVPGLVIGRAGASMELNQNFINVNAKRIIDRISNWEEQSQSVEAVFAPWQNLNNGEFWTEDVSRGQEAMTFEAIRGKVIELLKIELSSKFIEIPNERIVEIKANINAAIKAVDEVENPCRISLASIDVKRMGASVGVVLSLWFFTGSFILSAFLLMLYNNFSAIKDFVQAQDWGKLKPA
ncbi:hypothetical protein AYO37_01050 [Opitutia bacterium SCGC AG-212-L18]|nr:hypothetical protein AYO37_01050 [Opitutae bacterium SCGC AG-212-L18]